MQFIDLEIPSVFILIYKGLAQPILLSLLLELLETYNGRWFYIGHRHL